MRVERLGASKPARRGKQKQSSRRNIDVSGVDFSAVPASTAKKLERRLAEAAVAFEAERFSEADQLLASIERLAPGVAEVQELRGLTLYRLGHWKRAATELEAFAFRTGSVEQHPVWADCCRALKHWSKAEELWIELGEASPSAALVEEGRIVQAGTLADRGQLSAAVRFLEASPKVPRRPGEHHLRRWYVLADLYERTGDLAHARRVFSAILEAESEFGDVAERLANLG